MSDEIPPNDVLDDFITLVAPTEKRKKGLSGESQQYLSEGAVMLAYALHLFQTSDARLIELHPDGEHGKRFAFRDRLHNRGFELVEPRGSTAYGGTYRHADGREIDLNPKSGLGDIVADHSHGRVVAEAKGGILNTKHPGPTSRLRQGLCEAIGLLFACPIIEGVRQVAVVPDVEVTRRLADRMLPRLGQAGISIAFVDRYGKVRDLS